MMLMVLQVTTWMSRAGGEPRPAEPIADLTLEIIDLVQEHHVDPPVRQQMLLDGIRAVYQRADRPQPAGLSRRVSSLAGKQQERELLVEICSSLGSQGSSFDLETDLLAGLSASVHGELRFIPAKEFNVEEQLRGNRYVGIGVALGGGESGGGPIIRSAFPQGVAYQAGIRANDQIIQIEGLATERRALRDLVELLRGPEGSTVSLLIKRRGESEPLSFSLKRSVVPFQSVLGYAKTSEGTWDYSVGTEAGIGYVQISEVRASTLHELRQIEQRLRSQGHKKLILDLRFNDGAHFHDTLLLADGLLPETAIGRLRRPRGEETFQSSPDCLFRDWPLAVLIEPTTRGAAEWLAAALHDGRQALLVGLATAGAGQVIEPVKLPGGQGVVRLWSGVLHRADGRSLLAPNSDFFHRNLSSYLAAVSGRLQPRETKANEFGVQPDIKVAASQDSLRKWIGSRATFSEDQPAAHLPPTDFQFDRAVQELSRKQ